MSSKVNSVKVATVQAMPAIFDLEATVNKTVDLIGKAGAMGAKIILFPEAFISGYPKGMHLGVRVGMRTPEGRKDFRRYVESAIMLPGPETERIGKAVAKIGSYVIIGVIEKEEGTSTVYCTAAFFGPDGSFLGKHRKLKPTAAERLIWGEGDGSTLPVFDTPYGKIGAVICWENYMPLLRAAMYGKGVRIYLAPTFDARDRLAVLHATHCDGRALLPANLQSISHQINLPNRPALLRGAKGYARGAAPRRQRHLQSHG